ncbi:tyrosinase family oxidase copper chaperone [Streptomyces sp. NPDC000931]|uniref:tyrosinase family oxidase copper chaperone n=1 Tax=Streptomyces sp. NPDC000931 TaxID=3154372 RepID=UPI0033262E2F
MDKGVGPMVIDIDGTSKETQSPPPPAPEGRTRRDVTRGLRTGALAAALAPLLAAFRAPRPTPGKAPGRASFDRTHRGHRIQGTRTADGHWHVTVDGRPLHLMRRADGTWLSMVDHYCSYPTPLAAARAAVDALAPGERLREAGTEPRHEHGGGRHGVRA